jgi:hypothetical protein
MHAALLTAGMCFFNLYTNISSLTLDTTNQYISVLNYFFAHRCKKYKIPFLESGTYGAKASTQIILPHLTQSYSDTSDYSTSSYFPSKVQDHSFFRSFSSIV